jgi:phosphohistidine phosphatase
MLCPAKTHPVKQPDVPKEKQPVMRRLMLLRHAKADTPEGIRDHDRPLAPRGRRQCQEMGKYMGHHGLEPDLVIVSTARRTQETWELLRPAFSNAPAQQNEGRIYEALPSDILQVIKETADSVRVLLLIGHNPGFERLAASLIGTGRPSALTRLGREFPTAGLAIIDFTEGSWDELSAGSGHLERFETLASIGS